MARCHCVGVLRRTFVKVPKLKRLLKHQMERMWNFTKEIGTICCYIRNMTLMRSMMTVVMRNTGVTKCIATVNQNKNVNFTKSYRKEDKEYICNGCDVANVIILTGGSKGGKVSHEEWPALRSYFPSACVNHDRCSLQHIGFEVDQWTSQKLSVLHNGPHWCGPAVKWVN